MFETDTAIITGLEAKAAKPQVYVAPRRETLASSVPDHVKALLLSALQAAPATADRTAA